MQMRTAFNTSILRMLDERRSVNDSTQTGADDVSTGGEVIVSPARAAKRARWAEMAFLAGLSVCAVLALLAHRYAYFAWDVALARGIQSISLPGFETLMRAVSLLGSGWIALLLVVVAGLALIKFGLSTESLVCTAGTGLGWVVNMLLKMLIGRPRPDELLLRVAGEYHYLSFPSGHVVFFVEFFGFLFFLAYVLPKRGWLRRTTLIASFLLISLVGLSRVYLGAHWPSDVVGAYLAGGIWLIVIVEVYRRIKARR